MGPIPPPSAFIELVANTYLNYLLDKDMRSTEFHGLGRLVNSVPVRSVDLPDGASELGAVTEVIARDVNEVLASRSIFL